MKLVSSFIGGIIFILSIASAFYVIIHVHNTPPIESDAELREMIKVIYILMATLFSTIVGILLFVAPFVVESLHQQTNIFTMLKNKEASDS